MIEIFDVGFLVAIFLWVMLHVATSAFAIAAAGSDNGSAVWSAARKWGLASEVIQTIIAILFLECTAQLALMVKRAKNVFIMEQSGHNNNGNNSVNTINNNNAVGGGGTPENAPLLSDRSQSLNQFSVIDGSSNNNNNNNSDYKQSEVTSMNTFHIFCRLGQFGAFVFGIIGCVIYSLRILREKPVERRHFEAYMWLANVSVLMRTYAIGMGCFFAIVIATQKVKHGQRMGGRKVPNKMLIGMMMILSMVIGAYVSLLGYIGTIMFNNRNDPLIPDPHRTNEKAMALQNVALTVGVPLVYTLGFVVMGLCRGIAVQSLMRS